VRSAFAWKQKHLQDTTRAFSLCLETETPARHNTCVQPLLGNRNTCKTQHVRSAFDWKQKHLQDTTRAFGLGLEGLRVPLCIRIKKV